MNMNEWKAHNVSSVQHTARVFLIRRVRACASAIASLSHTILQQGICLNNLRMYLLTESRKS